MATMPMGMEEEMTEAEGGYSITIGVSADGTISVDVTQAGQESEESTAQEVPDWKAAMQVATDIYKNSGQMKGGGEAAMRDEFYKNAGKAGMMPPSVR